MSSKHLKELVNADEEESVRKIKTLGVEINNVQLNIDTLARIKDGIVGQLEKQKKEIGFYINKGYKMDVKCIDIEAQVSAIENNYPDIMAKMELKYGHIEKAQITIDMLTDLMEEMDKRITQLQDKHDVKVLHLEQRKEELQKDLDAVEELTLLINALTYKVYESQENYAADVESLEKERKALQDDPGLSEEEKTLALAKLDRDTINRKQQHEEAVISLHQQRAGLQMESMMKSEVITRELIKLKEERQLLLDQIERGTMLQTPSKIDLIKRKVSALQSHEERNAKINDLEDLLAELDLQRDEATPSELLVIEEQMDVTAKELANLKSLQERDHVKSKLKSKGLKLSPSGYLITRTGRGLTLMEARQQGLLHDVKSTILLNLIKDQHKGEGDSANASNVSVQSMISSEDVHYLKRTVGKPLTLGLAEITMKQPRDPIHYLAHWLIKYRYNQELDEIKRKEVDELTAERERIAKETLHRIVEQEARAAVIEMITRAEETAMKKKIEEELKRIAEETAMLEEENEGMDDEARDILGKYGGPPASSNQA